MGDPHIDWMAVVAITAVVMMCVAAIVYAVWLT